VLFPIAGLVFGAYVLGEGLRAGTTDAPMDLLRIGTAGAMLFIVFLATSRTVQVSSEIDHVDGLLTTVSHRDIVAGALLAEGILWFAISSLPILAVAVAFAFGAASVTGFVTIVVSVVGLLAFGLALGYPIGLLVKLAFTRSQLLAQYKTTIGVVALLAYFGVIFSNSLNAALAPLLGVLKASPPGWFADLALAGAPGGGVAILRAVGAVGTVLLGVPLFVGASIVLAGRLWYGDAVQPGTDDTEATPAKQTPSKSSSDSTLAERFGTVVKTNETVSDRLFGGLVSQPALRVAQKDWRRAQRAPLKLWYAAYPLFLLGFQIGPILDSGQVPGWVVLYIAIVGAWATGAAFALNPLGDEGAVLPATLTASVSGTKFVNGTILAGVAAGVPLTVLVTLALGAISPLGLLEVLGVAALSALLCVGATALAAGIGVVYPKFEQSRITRSRKAVVPSLSAFAVYTLALVLLAVPGILSQFPSLLTGLAFLGRLLSELIGAPASIAQAPSVFGDLATLIETTSGATLAGLVLTALLAACVSALGYRHAARRFDGYTL